MNVHTIHEQPQQTGNNTNTILGEAGQVSALLHIIETLQAQSEGLSEVQQRTIEELKGRVKQLTDKQRFLESELLTERQKSAELKKQHESQQRARLQQERARLEAARRANEEKKKQLEAEKARKKEEIETKFHMAWKCLGAAKTIMGTIEYNRKNGITSTTWTESEKLPSVDKFYTGRTCFGPGRRWRHCYKINMNDPDAEAYLLKQINKYEPQVESLIRQKDFLSQ